MRLHTACNIIGSGLPPHEPMQEGRKTAGSRGHGGWRKKEGRELTELPALCV